jgi:serine/threonine protein phosphatase PrpC
MQTSRDEVQTNMAGYRNFQMGSATHVGRVRGNNEDNYRIVAALNLFVLSDGIGGQANGEVASALAVDTIVAHCLESSANGSTGNGNEPLAGVSDRTNHLVGAASLANRAIRDAAAQDPQLQGMGATVVAAWIDGLQLSLVHVGDSRAYLLRNNILISLTADHTLVAEQVRNGILTPEQAQTNPLRRLLIRALGASEEVEIDIREQKLQNGDILLLCTDGLTGMVPEPEIAEILQNDRDAQSTADRLVASANEHGGEDNVTVILVQIAVADRTGEL